MNESDELFEQIRDCSRRLRVIAITTEVEDGGMLSVNSANDLSAIIAELRDIAREIENGQ